MKLLIVLLVLSQTYFVKCRVPRALPFSQAAPRSLSDPVKCDKPQFTCTDDCKQLLFCSKTGTVNMNCPDYGMAYCDPKTKMCTNTKPSNCKNTPSTEFTCPEADGVFPDPESCKKYYVCSENDAYHFECQGVLNYDHKNQACRPSVPCYSFTTTTLCRNQLGRYVAYPPNKNLYAFCTKNKAILMKCQENFVYDPSKFGCVFNCPEVGRFAHDDPKTFYDCYKEGSFLKYNVVQCPGDLVFDEMCVKPKKVTTISAITTK